MVAGNHWIAHEDAFIFFDAAAHASEKYLVGQDKVPIRTVFVLPLKAGTGFHIFRWHADLLSLINGLQRFWPEWSIGISRIYAPWKKGGR
jgi:hypothetical protein